MSNNVYYAEALKTPWVFAESQGAALLFHNGSPTKRGLVSKESILFSFCLTKLLYNRLLKEYVGEKGTESGKVWQLYGRRITGRLLTDISNLSSQTSHVSAKH